MKKILLLHNTLRMGGAERMRYILLKNLRNPEYNIKICCLKDKGKLGQAIEGLGYKIDELNTAANPVNLFTTYKLIRYLKGQRIDILHTCLFNSNFHGRIAALLCGIPNVITEEHSEHYLYTKMRHLFYIFFDFLFSRFTDVIICCSDTVREDILKKEKLPSSKLRTIRNCLDPDMYKPKASRKSIRDRFGIKDETTFIMTASFTPKKRHTYFLSALKHIKDMGYSFRCFFAGEGPTEEEVKEKIKVLDLQKNIIFLGKVENIEDYLNAADVFVLPSIKEGLSIALIEAMYMGLPCIATDIFANKELIENYTNGILIPLYDIDRFGKALMFCLNNKKSIKEMGEKAKTKIEEKYLVKDYVNKFCNIWDSLNGRNIHE